MGYYKRFVKNYGIISRSLTQLLKNEGFKWDAQAEATFEQLKRAMSEAPMLGLPDLNKTFVLETEACETGIEAVLMQEGRPLAFFSQALAPRHVGLSIYEKEFVVVLMAIDKWRHYLKGAQFVIKTDHQSLKFLL